MASSLLTGVSGLIAHQQMLNVVGNNIANINTTAYKSQQSRFADLMYESFRPAANSGDQNSGGTNPSQIGNGVRISSISRHFSQGSIDLTGGTFDFALNGRGFFVVNDGGTERYTRAGSFGPDFTNSLVDPATGARLQRIGTVGEGSETSPAFQTPGDMSISIPFDAIVSGQATTEINIKGNLSSSASSPVAAEITGAPFLEGDEAATRDTLLNDLDSNLIDYEAGDEISLTGMNSDGTAIDVTINVDDNTTLGDLVDAVDAALTDSVASLGPDGALQITANSTGRSLLSLAIKDVGSGPGATDFGDHSLITTLKGAGPGSHVKDINVIDSLGERHTVTLTFQRRDENHTWDVTATLPGNDGEVIDGSIEDIRFDEQGDLAQVFGTGAGDSKFTFRFDGLTTPQEVDIEFGEGEFTQKSLGSELSNEQDGLEPGKIVSVRVASDGVLMGIATNGRVLPIAQLAIATFENQQGLSAAGSNYFDVSLNSGEAQLGTAQSGSKGAVQGGALEGSNVDVAFEFTRLIIAQRGFSANARTITISDQMLEELTNMIR